MMILVFLFFVTFSINSYGQNSFQKGDTLRSYKNVMLYLDNGFAIPPFAVSGDIYLTNEFFIFHPKTYRRKRFDMYNDLIKDIFIPYYDIVAAKRKGIFTLKVKTVAEKFKISYSNNWGKGLKATIDEIRRQMKEPTSKVTKSGF
jgi:hypothetical protein